MIEIENVVNKSCSPNLIFREENNFRKYWVDIWPWKLTLNSGNAQFLMILPQTVLQDIKKSFEYAHWGGENLLNFTWVTIKFQDPNHACSVLRNVPTVVERTTQYWIYPIQNFQNWPNADLKMRQSLDVKMSSSGKMRGIYKKVPSTLKFKVSHSIERPILTINL